MNPTNICKDICLFCAYSASRKNPSPYTMSHLEIMSIIDNEEDSYDHKDKVDKDIRTVVNFGKVLEPLYVGLFLANIF